MSSPGRLCLLGEHCDWAGGHSIAVPLDLRVKARFTPSEGAPVLSVVSHHIPSEKRLEATYSAPLNPGRFRNRKDPLRYVAATWTVLRHEDVPVGGGRLELESTLPMGRGFSSSAALCVAAARALSGDAFDTDFRKIARWATVAERDLVGIACGALDPLACAADGALFIDWSEPNGEASPVHLGEPLHLVAGVFSKARDAPGILHALQEAFAGRTTEHENQCVREAIQGWSSLAAEARAAIQTGALSSLGDAMNEAQSIYEERLHGVLPPLTAPGLIRVCKAAREEGALGAKFSGAGGDGSVVVLVEDQDHAGRMQKRLAQEGLQSWATRVR